MILINEEKLHKENEKTDNLDIRERDQLKISIFDLSFILA